ncbi:hypothetical protein MMYC01_203153 [Madurella mycetomatis]|uniref:Uncharacterized protein n=1 Tax=Madurella mycetomatis TaxID=100816 RepID=A0A175W2C3_9PEZI|nr:hypothetical protein MMYC01_203153 [Madurella mycetomatis]
MGSPTNIESSAMQGMMDDLGIGRLDELPLDEGNNDRSRHRQNHNGGGEFRRSERRGSATPVAVDASLGNLWNNAIASGAFDDEDAAEVKGLSDLGGGRLYDTSTRPRPGDTTRRATAINQTLAILGHGGERREKKTSARNNAPVPAPAPAPAPSFMAFRQANPVRRWVPYIQPLIPLGTTHRQLGERGPLAPAPNPVPDPLVSAPVPSVQVVNSVPPSTLELKNVVFKASVMFLSRDINPALPAMVYLSSSSEPELGSFTVLMYNRKLCEWPILAWNDYSTGANSVLGVRFMDQDSTSQGYELSFNNQEELIDFVASMRSLKAEEHLGKPDSASPSGAKLAIPIILPVPAPVPITKTRAIAADLAAPPVINGGSALSSCPDEGPVVDGNAIAAIPNTGADMVSGCIQVGAPMAKIDVLVENTPIDLNAEGGSVAPSRALSKAAKLLSTLDPYENDSGSGAPEVQLSREQIITTARNLLGVFLLHSMGGKTKSELAETVDEIKSGIMEFMVQCATDLGMSPQKLQEMHDMINGVFNSMRPPSLEHSRPCGNEARTQYSLKELLSLRQAAVDPPASLANIHLPLKTPDTTLRRSHALLVQSQLKKSAGRMRWALGHAGTPTPEQQNTQGVPVAANPKSAQNSGLKTSRWAPEGIQVKHENYFTGSAYEREWPTRSHLQDLAELYPEAKVTSGAEDVINHFFPDWNRDEDGIGWAEFDGVSGATDSVETLRRSVLGLVQAASEEAARSSMTAPRLRGLGASRHSAGASPATAGRFSFHLPR